MKKNIFILCVVNSLKSSKLILFVYFISLIVEIQPAEHNLLSFYRLYFYYTNLLFQMCKPLHYAACSHLPLQDRMACKCPEVDHIVNKFRLYLG